MRLARCLLAGAACALVLAPQAVAAPGDKLTQLSPALGCVAATNLGVGCAVGRSLDLPAGLTLSPGGAHLYAPTFLSEAITVFARDADSGRITQLAGAAGCVDQVGNGVSCADGRGLRGAGWAEVSSDGAYVYVAARFSKAISIFARDASSGALTQLGCVADLSTAGTEGCSTPPFPLGGVNTVALSPDGRQLYAGSFDGDQVSVFARDTATGALTMVSCINAAGSGGCAPGRHMGRIFAVLASADGKNVYATAYGSDAVDVLARDETTGALTQLDGPAGCIAELGDGVTCADGAGLDGAHDTRLSADGRIAYVASNESDAITVWQRDVATGALTAYGCVGRTAGPACGATAVGIDGVQALAPSPGGESLYSAAVADDAIAAFALDSTTGALTQLAGSAACISESGSGGTCEDGVGLDSAAAMLVSPDGRFAYATGAASDAITVYERGARPVASFTALPDPAPLDEPVTFDGSASSDADGTIVTYEWDLDGNASFETNTGSSPTTTRAYAVAGSVAVGLRVTDDDGRTAAATRTIEVSPPPDTSPPVAPSGVSASGGDGQVSLDWSDNAERDLAGYDVYRASQSGGPYQQLNAVRLTASAYTDTALVNGAPYFYVVRATDTSANQSADSAEVSATPQAPPPSAYRSAVMGTAGLVSYWRLGELSGMVAADQKNVNPGAYVGGPTLGMAGALTGDLDAAARFDGVNDEMTVSGPGLALATNGSLEGWFDIASKTTLRDHTISGGWILSFSNAGKLAYRVGGTTYTTTLQVSSLTGWHHYVATKAGSSAALYIDGQLVHSGTGAANTAAIMPWHLMRNGNRAEYAAGNADEIAIYDQALDPATIAAHHQAATGGAPPPPDTSPPVAPSGVSASGGDGQVSLDWSDNAERDLAGYDVYRASQSGGPYQQLNAVRLTASAYTDTALVNGAPYFYVVRATDTSANQSADSAEVSATPQAPPPSAYRSAVMGTAGLVSYWRLGELSGMVAADQKNVNPGAYVGGPTLGMAGALTGDLDAAARFDGVNDEMSVSGPGLALATNGSLEGWFDIASKTTLRDHTISGGWILSFSNAGKLAYRVGGTTYTTTLQVSSLTGWHHYVATKAGSSAALYIDGQLVHSGTGAANTAAIMPWHLMRNGNRAEYTAGNADEIAIYDQALDPATIAAHHQAGMSG